MTMENALYLGRVLGKHDLTEGQYVEWLGSDSDMWELFNIKRFEKHMERLNTLEDGYYWVKYTEDEWEIAIYRDGEFDTFNQNGVSLFEMLEIDTNRIMRGGDEVSD